MGRRASTELEKYPLNYAALSLPKEILFKGAEGLLMNNKYWFVKYTLKKDNKEKNFDSSENAVVYPKVNKFYYDNINEWNGAYFEIQVSIKKGVSAKDAIEDVYSTNSSALYRLECYTATNLIALYAMLQVKDENFDNRYQSFNIILKYGEEPQSSLIPSDFNKKVVSCKFESSNIKKCLKKDDWVFIQNHREESENFIGENAIYLGNESFYGFGLTHVDKTAIFTIQSYGTKIQNIIQNNINNRKLQTQVPTIDEILKQTKITTILRRK